MDAQAPDLSPLFGDAFADVTGEDDDDDEELSTHLLEDDEEEEDAIIPPNTSRPPSNQSGEPPSSSAVELDLLEVCRRAVAKLTIDWSSQQVGQGAERDLYDGKRLPSRLAPVRQFILAVPACMAKMKRHWDKPFSHHVPVARLEDRKSVV